MQGFRLGGHACEALRDLLASCRKEGVPTALVFTPEGPAFRSWYTPESMRDVQRFIEQLSRQYAAPIIDCREWIEEHGFLDSNHLLTDGGARFADRLGREYIVPLLRRQSGEEESPQPTRPEREPQDLTKPVARTPGW